MNLLCPICGEKLNSLEKTWVCPRGHSFDVARQGYVNLLSVQQKHALHPGDTLEQVRCRREFLEAGFYAPIARTLMDTAAALHPTGPILDVGCGEGYYAARLSQALNLPLTGLDISKEAVRLAAGKYKHCQWLCATAAHIPLEDASVGLLTSLFALTVPEEFHRVLAPGGYFLQVLAAQDHLLGLKSVIYDHLDSREKVLHPELPGFALTGWAPIRFSFTVEGRQVENLLSMTPHLFRITKAGAQRLADTDRLTDTASCVLNIYQRR